MIKNPAAVDVLLWGNCIGRLTWDADKQLSVFQFSDSYFELPYDICPSTHKKGNMMQPAFYGRPGELYQGLPEFIADSLPDKYIHALGIMGKRSSVNIVDFVDFAEGFIDNPQEKIERVLASVSKFGMWCDKYNIDPDIRSKIQSALDFVRPNY